MSPRPRTHTRTISGTPVLLVLLALGTPGPASAQTLLGRVLDEARDRPVGGARVSLVARDGSRRTQAIADSTGRFVLRPPESGEFYLHAEAFGYTDTRSPLLALSTEGTTPIDLMMVPEPIGLEGFDISVEDLAAEELASFGVSPRELGNRWIGGDRIEAIPIKVDMGSIIESVAVSNTRIIRPGNLRPGGDDMGLCVSLTRARRAGRGTCALIVLDGVPIGGPQALGIDPESIAGMAVLLPTEATTYYGTLGGAGAALVWTKRGGS